jgi:type II secretory pathway component PulC
MHGVDWTAFRDDPEHQPAEGGAIARRFRLVGTFLAYSSRVSDGDVIRKAVLDDALTSLQRIVSEREVFDGITVVRVARDRVTMNQGGRDETLTLRFESSKLAEPAQAVQAGGPASGSVPISADGQDRFGGRQVGENKWVFDRRPLVDYYAELRDNPERLVKLFDSFKPVYDERRRVSGYRVKHEGEPEFLRSVGLREGDVVRTVNSMRMTSQRRAEFFIREFIDNRSNAFVLEIERGGLPVVLTYQAL